ncbi:MAG: hypothetical protein JWO71_4227 [Candidatus Acidoferrum typicum]|nr:hypothetical protein [Candidatus Acidoferrum typicum]
MDILRVGGIGGADWIHPDVPGNVVGRVVAAEDVVVEFFLPERLSCFSLERYGCFGSKSLYELEEIAGLLEPLSEEMNVIGHQTEGVNSEVVGRGVSTKDV